VEGTIGPYKLLRKIGEGGMGAVFLGEHSLLGRRAAIKVLLPELSQHRTNVDRFFNEALATTSVSDPGIVQVFDFGYTPDQTAYIVMEYLEGEQLDLRLAKRGSLPIVDALRITRQVAGSLAAAHANGIVHRDIKPANLFLVRDADAANGERTKILDFGIAKLGKEISNRVVTSTGQVIGTPQYMSPEQCNGSASVDQRSDVYSLGCVLVAMLTGRPPFDLDGVGAVMSAHLYDPIPLPSRVIHDLPREIDELVVRCLSKKPEARFANMLELQRACDQVSAGLNPSLGITKPLLPPRHPNIAAREVTTLSAAAAQPSGVVPNPSPDRWLKVGIVAAAVGIALAAAFTIGMRGMFRNPASIKASSWIPALPEPARPAPITKPPPPVAEIAAPIPSSSADAPTVPDARAVQPPSAPARPRPERHDRKPKPKLPQAKPEDVYDERN
jgi:serine/threonine protein kinase